MKGAGVAEGVPPQILLMVSARGRLGAGNACCCAAKLLSVTKEGICQDWFEASDGWEMEPEGAENDRVTAGRLEETNCGAPEAKEDEDMSPTTNCLIFSLAFAFKAASSRVDCGAAASASDVRIVGSVL